MEHVIELPRPLRLLLRAGLVLLESTILPLTVFYALLSFGPRVAVSAALGWSYANIARRLLRRDGVPAMIVLGTALVTVRAAVSLATGSTFIYLLQPTLGTFVVAALFLGSVPLRKPLTARLAGDFCPIPEAVMTHPRMHEFFLRISLLWGLVYLVNGSATLWLLLHQSVGGFVLVKPFLSAGLTGAAVVASYLWFRRHMRDQGVVLRWGTA